MSTVSMATGEARYSARLLPFPWSRSVSSCASLSPERCSRSLSAVSRALLTEPRPDRACKSPVSRDESWVLKSVMACRMDTLTELVPARSWAAPSRVCCRPWSFCCTCWVVSWLTSSERLPTASWAWAVTWEAVVSRAAASSSLASATLCTVSRAWRTPSSCPARASRACAAWVAPRACSCWDIARHCCDRAATDWICPVSFSRV